MSIVVNTDGFQFGDGLSSGCIVVEENRVDEYVEYINSKQITEIYIYSLYYKRHEIGFIARCPHIEEVNISSSITDFSGLYQLPNLRVLLLDEPNGEINISQLDKLEELATDMNKHVKGLNECKNLKTLRLWKYKPKSKNLEEISALKGIIKLVLTQTPLTTLKGCRDLPVLEKLELNYMRNLELIDGLEYNVGTLKSLRFDACKKIKNHEYVTCLKELEVLAFDNCGDIPSLGFLRELPKLNFLSLGKSNVVDGDLWPCIGLGHVGFQNKKHYSHKFKELNPNFKWHV